MNSVPNWADLPTELLEQIATCFLLLEDFTAFRGVCTTWRYAVITGKNKYQFEVPLLMVAWENLRRCVREFYSLSKRKICARLPFPELKGNTFMDVGFGWIVTVSADYRLGKKPAGEVSLVKPFNACPNIRLPNLEKYPLYEVEKWQKRSDPIIQQVVLLANPCETKDFMLVLLSCNNLACWRNGDKEWTKINRAPDIEGPWRFMSNMVHYKGCVYATDNAGRIWIWDPNGQYHLNEARVINIQLDNWSEGISHIWPSLVESTDGELLLILRHYPKDPWYGNPAEDQFRVLRVDLENCTTDAIRSVGKDAILIGKNNNITRAIAAADYPGVLRPNCIYFTSDLKVKYKRGKEEKETGIYDVKDGSIEWLNIFRFNPSMWIFPSF